MILDALLIGVIVALTGVCFYEIFGTKVDPESKPPRSIKRIMPGGDYIKVTNYDVDDAAAIIANFVTNYEAASSELKAQFGNDKYWELRSHND